MKALRSSLNMIVRTAGLVLAGLVFSGHAYAALQLNSATLSVASPAQGPTSVVYVQGGGTITAAVNGSTVGATNWRSTSWQIGAGPATCNNTPDFNNNNSTTTISFNITAPAAAGTYNASFIAYSDNACNNNASNTLTLPVSVVVDNTPPTTISVNPADANPTSAASVSWTVTFSESVLGVGAGNFTLVQTGGISGAAITSVTGGGTTWTVTASTGSGSGTLGLNLTSATGITDLAGNALTGVPVTGGTYTVNGSTAVTVTKSPTLCVNDTTIGTQPWTGLTNVGAQDNVYAQASGTNGQISNYLKCTGYGFNIPAGATISGITVGVWDYSVRTMSDQSMVLVKANVDQTGPFGTMDLATQTRFATADTQVIYGGAANLWGNTWTPADINSATFGAAFAAVRGPYATTDTAYVDYMPITINYRVPAGPTVLSINLASSNPTTPATSVSWTVTFSQSVTGVTASAFALAPSSGVSGATITSVTGSGTTWTVSANTGSGYGTLGLNQTGPGSVTPTLSGTFTGQVYNVYPPLTCITDNFNAPDNSPPDPANWNVGTVSGSFTPVIVGNRLRITDTANNDATRVTNKNLFPFGNNLVIAEFDYWSYGGSGADGIAITFSDPDTPTFGANDPPTTGGFGGSLGYANRNDTSNNCTINGFSGGWIGVGIDDYGNYSNPTECRNGGPGSLPNAVAIRGSGSGATSPSTSNYVYLTGTPALGANGVSSGNNVTPYRYRITLDSITDPSKVMVKVDQDTTGTGTSYVPLLSYDLKPAITAGTQAPLPSRLQFTYTGSTGGATNYHEVDNLSICAASVIPASGGPDHLEIQHPSGTGLTCAATTLTIRACADAACSALYTGGVTGTLSATGSPTVNWDGTTGGAAGAGFVIPAGSGSVTKNVQIATAGNVVFGITSPAPAPTSATSCNFGSPSCTFTAATAGFIFSNTTTGNIYTIPAQVSGTATPTLYLRAVQASTTNPAVCTPAIISQTAAVNMAYTCNNPATCQPGNLATVNTTSIPSSGGSVNLSFDANGSAPITLRYDDVGQITFNASMTATPFGGGTPITLNGISNAFVVAPDHFGFSSITPGLIKAGNNFSATVTAYNSLGTATPNFGKETTPGPEGVTLSFSRYQPSGIGAVNGSFSGSVGAFNGGSATGTNLNWSEVGTIDLLATLTSGSYLGSGLTATGTTGTTGAVGRFIPDHFDTYVPSLSGLPMLCPPGLTCPISYNGFVYSGEPFGVQIVAKNAGNVTTQNYDGGLGFSKTVTLSAWNAVGAVGAPNQNPGGGTFNNPNVAPAAFSAGVATTSTSNYALPNATSPTNIYLRAQDTDGVTSLLAVPANSIEGGVGVANGRLRLFNNYGSEKSSLALSVQAQYWSGKSWVLSSTDSTTTIPATSVALSNYRDSTGAPTGAWTTSASGLGTLSVGQGTLTLSAPSPAGQTGCVDVALNLGTTTQDNSCLANHPTMTAPASSLAWLRGENGNCPAPADPSATACFGVYSPETTKTIHVRELF